VGVIFPLGKKYCGLLLRTGGTNFINAPAEIYLYGAFTLGPIDIGVGIKFPSTTLGKPKYPLLCPETVFVNCHLEKYPEELRVTGAIFLYVSI
jgi:hypothetical protein